MQHRQVQEEEEEEEEEEVCRSEVFHNCVCCFSQGSWYCFVSSDVRTAFEKLNDLVDISVEVVVEQHVAETEKGRRITYLVGSVKSKDEKDEKSSIHFK